MQIKYRKLNERADELLRFYLGRNLQLTHAEGLAAQRAGKAIAPWHPEAAHLSPSVLLRCSIFRVAQTRAARQSFHRQKFPLQGSRGGYIEYTGVELRQSDGDLFMMLLKAEQETPGVVVVKFRQFAQKLGWGTTSQAVRRVEDSIVRMSATNLEVNSFAKQGASMMNGKLAFSLVLGYREEKPGVWLVYLDSRLWGFKENDYTWVHDQHLHQLPVGAVLASWLLKFLATHREPRAMRLDDLQVFCGSSATLKEFRRMAIEAAKTLIKVSFLEDFYVKNGELSVVRAPMDHVQMQSESIGDTPREAGQAALALSWLSVR